jgi:hypothetical protein
VEKEFPDKIVETLAYIWSRRPPKHIRPRPNVVIRLCVSGGVCSSHPLATCDSELSRAFRADLEGWAKVAPRIWIWDYVTDFAHYLLPFPNWDVLGPNIRFLASHGVRGVYEEGNYARGGGGDLSELRAYVLAKCLWDPDYDARRAVTEFTDAVYGGAGAAVREYLDLLEGRVRDAKFHVGIYIGPEAPYLQGDFLERAEALFDRGAREVKDPAALRRLKKARLPLDYVHLLRTAAGSPERRSRGEAFFAACAEFGITEVGEGRTVEAFRKAILP